MKKKRRKNYFSLTKLAFAKQRKPDLIRIISTGGVLMAIGYWSTSQKVSVPGSLPRISVPGRIETMMIFTNDIVTCNSNDHKNPITGDEN